VPSTDLTASWTGAPCAWEATSHENNCTRGRSSRSTRTRTTSCYAHGGPTLSPRGTCRCTPGRHLQRLRGPRPESHIRGFAWIPVGLGHETLAHGLMDSRCTPCRPRAMRPPVASCCEAGPLSGRGHHYPFGAHRHRLQQPIGGLVATIGSRGPATASRNRYCPHCSKYPRPGRGSACPGRGRASPASDYGFPGVIGHHRPRTMRKAEFRGRRQAEALRRCVA